MIGPRTRVAALALSGLLVLLVAGAIWKESRPGPPAVRVSSDPRPNVVLVVWDTARWDRTAPGGYGETTPHLARLARDSVVYTRARSPSPWTLPAHQSLFTGQLPGQHGGTWRWFDGTSSPWPGRMTA